MVTTVNRETESNVAVAAPVSEAAAASVDISAIPETPAELLGQWDAPRRNPMSAIVASLARFCSGLVGPGMTDMDRLNREIAEFQGHAGHARIMSSHH